MPTIASLIASAGAKALTIGECVQILTGSEGVAASALWAAPGHPLQHSHADSSGTGRRLEDSYHWRGPLPIEKVLQGGPNAGNLKAAITVQPDGSFTPKSNTFHSQFIDDDQAGMCLKLLLESKGGIWALTLLSNYPRVSATVSFGMPGGTKYLNREAHLVAAGAPPSNIIAPAIAESTYNFVLIDRKDMGSVVATLRSKDSPLGHLHVQTFYPTGDPLPAGSSSVEVTAKSPADYSGPDGISFR